MVEGLRDGLIVLGATVGLMDGILDGFDEGTMVLG